MKRLCYFSLLPALLLALSSLTACQQAVRRLPVSTLVAAHGPGVDLVSLAQDDGYGFFLELVQSGIELPHALVQRHTLIARPYGQFVGVELRQVSPTLHLIVLRQADGECIRHFLLTGNADRTLDQIMITEACATTKEARQRTAYRFRGEREVVELEVLQTTAQAAPESRRIQVQQTFTWDAAGHIVAQAHADDQN